MWSNTLLIKVIYNGWLAAQTSYSAFNNSTNQFCPYHGCLAWQYYNWVRATPLCSRKEDPCSLMLFSFLKQHLLEKHFELWMGNVWFYGWLLDCFCKWQMFILDKLYFNLYSSLIFFWKPKSEQWHSDFVDGIDIQYGCAESLGIVSRPMSLCWPKLWGLICILFVMKLIIAKNY